MRFSEIIKTVKGEWLQGSDDSTIDGIRLDSRRSANSENELFIALVGPNHNGHDYVHELIEKGVKHFIVSEPLVSPHKNINICQVTDSLVALQALGKAKRLNFEGEVIGLTGSNGKTIVKEWLFAVLSKKFNIVKSPKSFNSQVGVPLSLWLLQPQFDKAIIEAGISQPGEMQMLENLISPNIGIFTNIGSAHGENFEDQIQKIEEKAQLFKHARAVICSDQNNSIVKVLRNLNAPKVITWGQSANNDFVLKVTPQNLSLTEKNGQKHHFILSTDKFIFLENICHVIVTSIVLGVSDSEIQACIAQLSHDDLRLSIKRGVRGNYLVDDSYNNDLEGLKLALDFLDLQNLKEDRVVILSDLIQTHLNRNDLEGIKSLITAKKIKEVVLIGEQLKGLVSTLNIPTHSFGSTEEFLSADLIHSFAHKLVLIKGSRKFKFERIVHQLSEKIHKTRLEVDLNAITHNLNTFRKLLRPKTKIMVMVKAFAYGAGSLELTRLLQYQKVDYLGVAYVDEGVELRKSGVEVPIMVMNPTAADADILMKNKLEPEIYDLNQLITYTEVYKQNKAVLHCHIIINSGMNRLGFEPSQLKSLIEFLRENDLVLVKSIFTHLAAADDPKEKDFTIGQINTFKKAAQFITGALNINPLLHCLNSAGIAHYADHQQDMVRLGIGLHGISPKAELAQKLQLPSQLKSVISQVRWVKKGETIGYSRRGKAARDMRIATVAIGYADGYTRQFGNGNAYMLVNGQKAFTVGNICMDMCMIDVTSITAEIDDEVIIFGTEPTIAYLSEKTKTIPYEILTNISARVQRLFHTE